MTNLSVRDSAVGAVERLRHPIDNHMKTDLSNGGNELSHDRKNPTVYDTCREQNSYIRPNFLARPMK
jgi:hypothetical protein